jgi:quercetin dioxygenase-like cupin family protein
VSTDPRQAGTRTIDIRNLTGTIRVRGEETGSALAVIEHVLPPGYVAMPLHRHSRETETTHVLEGVLTIKLAGRLVRARPGDLVVKPVGVFHTFWNAGTQPARFLELITPAGLERYYEEVHAVVPRAGEVPIERVLELSRGYGLEFDMASLLDIIETHQVKLA